MGDDSRIYSPFVKGADDSRGIFLPFMNHESHFVNLAFSTPMC